jgi:hypothetical protein
MIAAQKVGRFSFFQGLNYEKTGSIQLSRYYSKGGPAAFQWPDVLHAAVRLEFRFFKRSYRSVSAFYDLRMRQSGAVKYGTEILIEKDRVFFSAGGLLVKVDPELTVTGQYSYFPFEINPSRGRPDFGGLLLISVAYTPF